jgi:hypothetical protein
MEKIKHKIIFLLSFVCFLFSLVVYFGALKDKHKISPLGSLRTPDGISFYRKGPVVIAVQEQQKFLTAGPLKRF